LSPGGSDTFLTNGSNIAQTQSAIVLESIINKFFANYASRGAGESGAGDSQGKGTETSGKAESHK